MTSTNDAREALRNSFADWTDVMDRAALRRYREDVLDNSGHSMAVLNHNSLRRLLTLIDRQAAALANHSPDAGGAGEREAVIAWMRGNPSEGWGECSAGEFWIIGKIADAIERGEHRPDPRGEG